MTQEETRQLLGEIAALDNRKLSVETARQWHELLHNYTLAQCRDAVSTFRKRRPDDWLLPGHIAQIVNRNAGHDWANVPRCAHGVDIGAHCHDCTHGPDCPTCQPTTQPDMESEYPW